MQLEQFANIKRCIQLTKKNKKITVNLAINYGSRQEIFYAFRKLKKKVNLKNKFKAFISYQNRNGYFENKIILKNFNELPNADLLIKVKYSSLNYKDALSASGNKGVTREYPHTPGIDAVGEVVESNSSQFEVGESIVVTGYDLGMNTYGVQEKNWGYRFISKSAIDKNKFSATADLGIGYSNNLMENLNLSLQLTNGEGYKKSQEDTFHKISLNATYGEMKINKNENIIKMFLSLKFAIFCFPIFIFLY